MPQSGRGQVIRPSLDKIDRRTFLRLSALVGAGAAAAMLVGCPRPDLAAPDVEGPAGDIVIIHGVDTECLNPKATTSFASRGMLQTMYDPLYYVDTDMSFYPGLAVSHEIIDDYTWEFKLREGVTFHNGEEFSAEHVKKSLAYMLDPSIPSTTAHLLAPIKEVEIIDPHTVRMHTSEPYALLLTAVGYYLNILPHAITREEVDAKQTCIGAGPFEFVEWIPGERLVVKARPDGHWSPQPRVNKITFRPVPEEAARIVELKTGRAHLVTPINPVQVAEINADPNCEALGVPSAQTQYLHLNWLVQPAFEDARVRQALNYAVDLDLLVERIMMGCAYPLGTICGPAMEGHDPDVEPYPYDPDKARQLLADAGYSGGLEVEINSPSGRYLNDRQLCEAIAEMWTEVGVTTNVRVHEWGPYVEGIMGRKFQSFYFQIGGALIQQPVEINFHSGVQGLAWQGYHNDEVNEIIEAAPKTMDPDERESLYRRMAWILREEAAVVNLFNPEVLWGRRVSIKDWEPHPDTVFRLGELRYEE